jgi:hypothetical protein
VACCRESGGELRLEGAAVRTGSIQSKSVAVNFRMLEPQPERGL